MLFKKVTAVKCRKPIINTLGGEGAEFTSGKRKQ
jgi:hypothetical protein